ncbi:hypothetical protein IJ22_14650 [Paenibacillus naphthalenovorans]|uniref:Uncharacterized protein n=1 Tax=Paenibacillus naphthalenovorans TaxID=162209 RepID=A0A0U2UIW8_9BACL|nr:hypothetical protein IJ22_14650 [Paenibacillus naphthalenovorans]SDI80899.1 hypothetical protein SAMN05421868_11128 [Paenibacillus naphthalenovorans]
MKSSFNYTPSISFDKTGYSKNWTMIVVFKQVPGIILMISSFFVILCF